MPSKEKVIERPLFRLLADAATLSRPIGTIAVCHEILEKAPDFRNWRLAAKLSAVLLTDAADGRLARYSNIPSVHGTRDDQIYDKLSMHLLLLSLGVATHDSRYFGYAGIKQTRNVLPEHRREHLRHYGLEAQARSLGKHKLELEAVAVCLDVSPVGMWRPRAVHALHIAGVAMSVVSGLDIEFNARKQLQEQNLEITSLPSLLRQQWEPDKLIESAYACVESLKS